MDSATEIARGEQARQVIENELYKEAFGSVREGIIQAWEAAPQRDIEGQHELKLMLKLLTDVQKNIERVMTTGKMAKIQVEREGLVRRTVERFTQ